MITNLILSHFNLRIGPCMFYSVPELPDNKFFKDIPNLIEFNTKGLFIQEFESYKCANLPFEIYSTTPRGNRELLLISIVTDQRNGLKRNIAKEILEQLVTEIKGIENCHKAFSMKTDAETDNIKSKIQKIINNFYESIHPTIRALENAEKRYQILFKSARDAIIHVSKNTSEILDINEEGAKLLEKEKEMILGEKFDNMPCFNKYGNYTNTNNLPKFVRDLKKLV